MCQSLVFEQSTYQNLHAWRLHKDKARIQVRLFQVLHAVHLHIENANLATALYIDNCLLTVSEKQLYVSNNS